jgi:hypothetical protein
MKRLLRARSRGQAVIFIAVLLGTGVLMGFVALAVDGGGALLQRRNMQNGADAAALGVAKMLAAGVVLNNGQPTYIITNAGVTRRVDNLLTENRGGSPSTPSFNTTLEYGNYIAASQSFTFTVAATFNSTITNTWSYVSGYAANDFVPNWVDAVRVRAGIDNPTTFGGALGFNIVPVSALAAAALFGVDGYTPRGPTWPMTTMALTPTPPPDSGICRPYLFWENQGGNFKNLVQMGARQGTSAENANLQLLTEYDARAPLADATNGDYANNCRPVDTGGLWSPKGNCTPILGGTFGNTCCDNSNIAKPEVFNMITYEFTGRVSLTSVDWPDINGGRSDRRSADARSNNIPGDWLEAYQGGNFGNNVQTAIYNYIIAHGEYDELGPYYGKHVDKVMYLYDRTESWERGDNPICRPNCPFEWHPTGGNESIERVHMVQALVFRFYEQMASTGGFQTPAARCGTSTSYNTSNSRVYGVFAGQTVNEPPPGPSERGLYNYIGFIDSGP